MKNAIALGTFDGVHIGHRRVLELPADYNRIAVVFKKSPKSVMNAVNESITSFADKCDILTSFGINEIVSLDFNEVRNIEAIDFLNLLKEKLNPSMISCGFNYHFGKNGAGNAELLKHFCDENGIELRCCEPVEKDSKAVSSTLIRNYLKNGEIEEANELLTRPFSYTSEIITGDQRGRTIGFPTINQRYPDELVKVRYGVYKTKVRFDNEEYFGITNIGMRPTYLSDFLICETYIINYSGDLYGKSITIEPLKFIRGEIKFSSIDELKQQIEKDINS